MGSQGNNARRRFVASTDHVMCLSNFLYSHDIKVIKFIDRRQLSVALQTHVVDIQNTHKRLLALSVPKIPRPYSCC